MRRETFSTPGQVRLDLELPAGADRDRDGEHRRDARRARGAVRSNERCASSSANARIESNQRGDGYEVTVAVRTRHGVWISFSSGPDIRLGTPDMRLRISCPQGAELDVKTKSADLTRRGEYGIVDVKTASGDMSADDSADAYAKTASGDVHLDDRRRVARRQDRLRRRHRGLGRTRHDRPARFG